MRKRINRLTATVLLSVMPLVSCAAFREGKLGPISDWPPPPGQKPSVRLAISGQAYRNGEALEGMGIVLDYWTRHARAMYLESGLFSTVEIGRGVADRVAEIDIRQEVEESIGMAILCGLTFTLIPAVAQSNFKVTTKIRNAEGDTLGTIEKAEGINTWIQMFMFFPMMVKFPAAETSRTINDLQRASIAEAHQRGLY